jgi:hypothetical protein
VALVVLAQALPHYLAVLAAAVVVKKQLVALGLVYKVMLVVEGLLIMQRMTTAVAAVVQVRLVQMEQQGPVVLAELVE